MLVKYGNVYTKIANRPMIIAFANCVILILENKLNRIPANPMIINGAI